MKIWLFSSVVAVALALGAPVAQAQDHPGGIDNFNGFYAGVLLSGVDLNQSGDYHGLPLPPAVDPVIYDYNLSAAGFGVGVLGGYAVPWKQFTVGVEGDISLTFGASATYHYVPANRFDNVTLNSLSHVRVLWGYPVGDFTPFVAAGLAVANVTESHTGPDDALVQTTWSQPSTQVGGSIGAGVQYKLSDGISLRGDVLEDFFPGVHYDWTTAPTARYSNASFNVTTVRVGMTFGF